MKEKVSVPFMLLGILFNVCLIAANLLETKVIQIGSLTVTAGLLVFPISYIINDCIAEVWGFKKARLIIWSGFAMNFFVVALGLIAVAIPAAPFWEGEEHFDFVFGMAPRIVAASLMAFLVGSFLNAYVMSKMKVASRGRHFSARAILSTLAGETADSLIFFPVAFGGIIAWRELLIMMCIQIILKSMYEVIILPVTIRVVKAIKKIDGSDVYDTDISYNVLKVKDIIEIENITLPFYNFMNMNKESALVVFSGGQDSTTCLFWAKRNFKKVYALSFLYGQKHEKEVELAREIARKAEVEFDVMDVSFIGSLGHNSLTDTSMVMDQEKPADSFPNTFVPGRNLFFLSIAAVYARERGINHLITGVSQTDFSGYPDCRDAFIKSLNVTLNLAMDEQFVIHTPLMWIDKAETWALADELGVLDVIRHETLTCYNGIPGDGCGHCPACTLRREGLEKYLKSKNQ